MKFSLKLIPITMVGLFVIMMTSGSFLKKPLNDEDDVMLHIQQLKENVQNEQWEVASDHLEKTIQAWKKVVKRIQFSVERDEINSFRKTLERTKGFIKAEEKGGALAEIDEAHHIWTELGK